MRSVQRRVRAVGIGALVAGLATAMMPAVTSQAGTVSHSASSSQTSTHQPATSSSSPAGPHQRPHAASVSVTLISGDRVVLPSADATKGSIVPGPGRSGVGFSTHRARGHLYVIPSDAVPLLRSGALDRRLFDVTGLVRAEYDDSRHDAVPLIVRYDGDAARARGHDGLLRAGGERARELPSIDATAVEVDKRSASGFWKTLATGRGEARVLSGGIAKVWLDGVRRPVLDESVPQIGAPAAWEAGFTGKGVTVAVLDTGIDATHPDLAGQVAAAKNFTEEEPGDGFGHGTHVASTIAGTAAASDGAYKGVAPEATLLDGKVCDSGGGCTESAILAGMEWAASEQKARVINLSLGGSDTPELDPLEEAVDTLTAATGALFVISAGNDGPAAGTVSSPGSADAALTVGAVDKQDALADFSSRGPRVGDGAVKPDVTAPGVDIVAAKAKGTELGEPVGEQYVTLSGTSMAAPHVAGAAALLAQQHPDWKAQQLKSTVAASAKPHPDQGVFEQGAGRVDVAKAITQQVTTDPVSVSFGQARWPHGDDEPVTKKLTYANNGSADVTLDLAVTLTGPDGEPAPASALQLGATSVTVPAGGTASVDVTSDTTHDGADGIYGGRITATAGDVTVATPLGVDKEVESYDLTIKHLDRQGTLSSAGSPMIVGLDSDVWAFPANTDGTTKIRLPKGKFLLEDMFFDGDEQEWEFTMLVNPLVTLDKNLTVTADARKAKPVTTTVQRGSVAPALIDIGYDRTLGDYGIGSGLMTNTFAGLYAGHLGPAVPGAQMVSHVASQWAEPGADQDFSDSPYFYGLLGVRRGTFYTGYERTARDRDLATVTSRFAQQVPGREGSRVVSGSTDGMLGSWSTVLPTRLPTTITSFLEPGSVAWAADFTEFVLDEEGWPADQIVLSAPPTMFKAGRTYPEQWNTAVFGPAFSSDWLAVGRHGNEIYAEVPMFSDGPGHLGGSLVDTARTTLYRDGKKVAESADPGYFDDVVTVPAAKASFRLEVSATRPTYSAFSTKVDTTWTFTSGRVGGEEARALPLAAVRFSPKVDQRNRNHEGREAMVPVTVQAQPDSGAGPTRHLLVAVSVDDGATWETAETIPAGDGRWVAVVKTPASGAEYVSLRAKATDSKGNSVEQTVLRAYAIGS